MVRDFQNDTDVDVVLMVRQAERRARRDGGEYLRVVLGDRTGGVTVNVWDGLPAVEPLLQEGTPVRVCGRYTVHERFGPQINTPAFFSPEPGSYLMSDLTDCPAQDPAQMEADLRALVATVQNPWLRQLLCTVFAEGSHTWEAYRVAPAAKHFHQAYRHGLLEHCLTVAQAVGAISATFPGIDRDVAVTGALLHDIGKLEAYTVDAPRIDMTDLGRLHGEIPLGYYRIRRLIEDIHGFPPDLSEAVLHIILSHHGSLEHGSPVVPCTREATLVHMIDNLGGRLGSFDRIEKTLRPEQAWSNYDHALRGAAFFPPVAPAVEPKPLRQAGEDAEGPERPVALA